MTAIPQWVQAVLDRLEAAGHRAWCVGGCVRDSLLGRVPADWDVATSARPEETLECFQGERLVEKGIAHGTVGVVREEGVVEATTFRVDGGYADHRRPRQVRFTLCLEEDLRRRDFTVNAMAYHPKRGLRDPFGGRQDLARQVLRCVGEPERRFQEDALRILRLLRFASALGFSMDPAAFQAALRCRELLAGLSGERVREEAAKLLAGGGAAWVVAQAGEILSAALPEVRDWTRAGQALANPKAPRWAALLRDCGEEEARALLQRLRFSKREAREVWQARLRLRGEDRLSRAQLAVNGRDLIGLGFPPGTGLGRVFRVLLQEADSGALPNERAALLRRARELLLEDSPS